MTSGFRLVDMEILGSVINCLACPECFGSSSLQLQDINEKKKGLARLLEIRCTSCPYKHEFYTSKQAKKYLEEDEKEKGGGKHMEINLRAVYGMRSIGVGHASLGKMCCHLNMPEPMNCKNYDKLSNMLRDAVKIVARGVRWMLLKSCVVKMKPQMHLCLWTELGSAKDSRQHWVSSLLSRSIRVKSLTVSSSQNLVRDVHVWRRYGSWTQTVTHNGKQTINAFKL